MTDAERRALAALRFDSALTPDDVWSPSLFHVPELHREAAELVVAGVRRAADSSGPSPLGVVIAGRRGTGKTHLLRWVREHVQSVGGYFFLISVLIDDPWESTATLMVDGLERDAGDQESQCGRLVRRLATRAGLSGALLSAVAGEAPLSRPVLDTFIAALRTRDRQVGLECQDTARAVALLASRDQDAQVIGHEYLSSWGEVERGERAKWGIRQRVKRPQYVVRDLSRLLALTGPSVVAVDQIDVLLAQARTGMDPHGKGEEDDRQKLFAARVADVLMSMRDITRRTLTVLACLPASWELLRTQAADTVGDRFRQPQILQGIQNPDIGRALIERRLDECFQSIGFVPPYPTWPVQPTAFDTTLDATPRKLLKELDAHVERCLRMGEVNELRQFDGATVEVAAPAPREAELTALDERFAQLKTSSDVAAALDPRTEDQCMPALLAAGLKAWTVERGEAGRVFDWDSAPSLLPALHARLRRTFDESTEDEAHWAVRAVASEHGNAALPRIRAARALAGLQPGVTRRRLFLLRSIPWSTGAANQRELRSFREAGGVDLTVTAEDLATFAALGMMLEEARPGIFDWLVARKPATRTVLLSRILDDAATDLDGGSGGTHGPGGPNGPGGSSRGPRAQAETGATPRVRVGTAIEGGQVAVDLEALRKHVAIFAGSGSGKTVLIRRLVEECALLGVSAIVLDPNNDLARLGDAWPAPPAEWGRGDAEKAEGYRANTEVVIWTPGREAGRPISFQPLPDFSGVLDDADEFAAAVDVAASALAPRANLIGRSDRVERSRGVLQEALRHFAGQGGQDVRAFIELMEDLPPGVSRIRDADKYADNMAQTLKARMSTDRLFAGAGDPVDPGRLLVPAAGKRARVSVISFIGLPEEDQQQGFVNQLQMALFAWIKNHPAGDRPLGGLFVMDEAQTFARSGGMTPCTMSTIKLASQARKYGLGLVFATQAPKNLNHQIPGNATTQFFGRLNAPAQIAAAQELARAKGVNRLEVARLEAGQFYATGDDIAFRLVRTPMCLTHHPRGPLTSEEVLERAANA